MNLEVTVTRDHLSAVLADLAQRRGSIQEIQTRQDNRVVVGFVPLAETMVGTLSLKSIILIQGQIGWAQRDSQWHLKGIRALRQRLRVPFRHWELLGLGISIVGGSSSMGVLSPSTEVEVCWTKTWHQPTISSLPSSYTVSLIASFRASVLLLPTSLSVPEQAPECWQSSHQRPGPGAIPGAYQCSQSSTGCRFFLRKRIQWPFEEVIRLSYLINFSANGQKISGRKRNLRLNVEEITDLNVFD